MAQTTSLSKWAVVWDNSEPLVKIILVLGGVVVFKALLQVVTVFYKRVLRPAKNIKKTYGSWGEPAPANTSFIPTSPCLRRSPSLV